MLETKITTTRATFARIDEGEPPGVVLHKILTRPDGKQKYVAMTIPVQNKLLLARAERELRSGEEVEVTLETHWAEEGIPKTLVDFAKVVAPEMRELIAAG